MSHKTKGLRIATRCTTLDQFVAAFHRFCDAQTVFISTLSQRMVGLETAFSIDLADHAPALRGIGVVLESWPTAENPFGRPGIRLGIRKLTTDSEPIFERLLRTAEAKIPRMPTSASPPVVVRAASPPAVPTAAANVTAGTAGTAGTEASTRTPGSDLVLPANPLMNLSDESLEGFVDCTLYEETANFFPPELPAEDPGDQATEPPLFAPNRVAPAPATFAGFAGSPAPADVSAAPAIAEMIAEATLPHAAPVMHDEPAPPPQRPIGTPPPLPLDRPVRMMTEPAEPFDVVAEPVPINPLIVPPLIVPLRRERPWRQWAARGRELLAGRRRWWVAGGVAMVTITTALAITSGSAGGTAAPRTPAPAPAVVATTSPTVHRTENARMAKPITDALPAESVTDPGADTGGAPVVGSGPCKVAVSTTPAGSIVSVDGETAGPTPITIGGPCTKRKLDIVHPRYQTVTRWITPDTETAIDVTLSRPTHDLFVETVPSGATISIDGHRAGTTPTMIKIMGFTSLSVKIEKFGFKPQTKKIYSKTPHDRLATKLGH